MRPIAIRKNMQRGCSNLRKYRWLARCAVAIGVMGCSLAAGAVTIREVINSSPALCDQFVEILKAAGVPHMTNAQLCQFRFDQLPASMTRGFTFPHWEKLKVSDPLEMFKRMVLANWRVYWARSATPEQFFGNYIQGLYRSYQLVVRATHRHAVAFYTTTLPARRWSGDAGQPRAIKRLPKNFYLTQMRVNICNDKALRHVPNPDYAGSNQPDLKEPFHVTPLDNGELALWHGDLLLINVTPWWLNQPESPPPSINASVNLPSWYPSGYSNVYKQPFRAGFDPGPAICSYSIEK